MADLLLLTCGWVAGVITTLAIRQALDDERRPLDPALLPRAVPLPRAALPALPPPPRSPYAPRWRGSPPSHPDADGREAKDEEEPAEILSHCLPNIAPRVSREMRLTAEKKPG